MMLMRVADIFSELQFFNATKKEVAEKNPFFVSFRTTKNTEVRNTEQPGTVQCY